MQLYESTKHGKCLHAIFTGSEKVVIDFARGEARVCPGTELADFVEFYACILPVLSGLPTPLNFREF